MDKSQTAKHVVVSVDVCHSFRGRKQDCNVQNMFCKGTKRREEVIIIVIIKVINVICIAH